MIGDRRTFNLKTLTSSDASIAVYPGPTYSERTIKDKNFRRTQVGQLNSFRKSGKHFEFNLPVDYVSSGDAHTFNQWWQEQTDLELILNEGLQQQGKITVRLYNIMQPLNRNVENNPTIFSGSLLLRSTSDLGIAPQPFILDSSVFGQLDDDRLG